MTKILVTNDDGVRSEGLHALAQALQPLGEVIVVAPQVEASAIGHALTLRRPLAWKPSGSCLRSRRHSHRLRQHRDRATLQPTVGEARPHRVRHQQGLQPGRRCHALGNGCRRTEGAPLGIPSLAVSVERSMDTHDFCTGRGALRGSRSESPRTASRFDVSEYHVPPVSPRAPGRRFKPSATTSRWSPNGSIPDNKAQLPDRRGREDAWEPTTDRTTRRSRTGMSGDAATPT